MSADASSVTYRWVALLMTVVAVLGWGLFFVMNTSAASVQDAQRHQIGRLEQERNRLDAAVEENKAGTAELSDLTTRLALTRDDLLRTKGAHDTATNQLIARQAELAAMRGELTAKQSEIDTAQSTLAALEQQLSEAREELAKAKAAAAKPVKKKKRTRSASRRKRR